MTRSSWDCNPRVNAIVCCCRISISLGWSVMTVWSVGAFVNPDKEVDRIGGTTGKPVPGARTVSAEHIENVMEHDDSQRQSKTHSIPSYSATRRTARKHKRVVRQGTELFDADGVKLEPSDVLTKRQREADDDKRILNELPPHWAVNSPNVAADTSSRGQLSIRIISH